MSPVAWRVKDYADGWILFSDYGAALQQATEMGGALIEPLYSATLIEECARVAREVIGDYRCCTDLGDKIHAALRALKDKP